MMKCHIAFRIAFIIPIISFLFFAGCSSDSIPAESNSLPPGSYYYRLDAANLRLLGAAEQYVLWLRMAGDSSDLISLPLTNSKISNDSFVFSGVVKLPHNPDSIEGTIVSIEPPALPGRPSSALMTGQFNSDSGYASLTMSDSGAVGDYSKSTGSVIFTTKSSDTNRAKSEFYLINYVNGVPTSSISNLPLAPAGWRYGLWVLDSSFYPVHKFFYGSFTDPNGPGSDSANAEFPFPGGYNPAPLTDPGAILEVTLEPDFSVDGNNPSAPSPIAILWLQLRQFIYFGQSIEFQNVWSTSGPTGLLKIWR